MIFDIFHSLGRVDSLLRPLKDKEVFSGFFNQAELAEALGFKTVWVAESHFSSELQKQNNDPVIPNYQGEVGLNTDSFQLFYLMSQRTKKLGFGTAITNIVGGNGGPIATADRVRMLAWANQNLNESPRNLAIGVASGRFPYINKPFGIRPRNATEKLLWSHYQKYIFLEALEIFLRLSMGETLASHHVTKHHILSATLSDPQKEELRRLLGAKALDDGIPYEPFWSFESLRLVPELSAQNVVENLRFVLGSHEPKAREVGLRWADLDIFNLSFTPAREIEKTHVEMAALISQYQKLESEQNKWTPWHRGRMPRTVLIFIDHDLKRAQKRADEAIQVYRQAMMGTVTLPPTEELLARALVGDPAAILDQLHSENPRGFHRDDRLMLWFEFNQSDEEDIKSQMRIFADEVMSKLI